METGAAKLRYVIATRRKTLRRVGILLVVVGILGVAVTLAFPPTTAVTEVTDRATVETQTVSSATVEGDHEFYDEGETLSDEPVYVRGVTPDVAVAATTRAPDGVTIDQELVLTYEATSNDGTVFRQQRRVLGTSTGDIETDDDVVETSATLRIDDIADTLAAMRDEIGDAGDVDVYLGIETDYVANGYDGTVTDREPLIINEESVIVPKLTATDEHHTTETFDQLIVDRIFQPTLPGIGTVAVPHITPLFLVVALFGVVALVAVRRGRDMIDPERARVQIHRQRYDEWISRGTLPPTLGEWSTDIALESLEGLVDVAIDTQTRVIYDGSRDCYAVVTDGATYVFIPSNED